MAFATESEAKHFLIERIAIRAMAEGRPLSDEERWILGFSEGAPEPAEDERPDSSWLLHAGDVDEEFEARMGDLLRRSYDLDIGVQHVYRDALTLLAGGDYYLSWIAEVAGLGRPMPEWLRPFKQVGLVVLLVVPALVALLLAGAGLWAAVGQPSRSRGEMVVLALVFAGFGTFLFGLWLKERRN